MKTPNEIIKTIAELYPQEEDDIDRNRCRAGIEITPRECEVDLAPQRGRKEIQGSFQLALAEEKAKENSK